MNFTSSSTLNKINFQQKVNSVSEERFNNGGNFYKNEKFQLSRVLQDYSENASTKKQNTILRSAAIEQSKFNADLQDRAINESSVESGSTIKGQKNMRAKIAKFKKMKNFLFF